MKASVTATFKTLGTLSVVEYMSANFRPNRCDVNRFRRPSQPLAFDEPREFGEKIAGIMRAGRGLGMILHTEDRQLAVPHSFDRAVVQIDVRHFHRR